MNRRDWTSDDADRAVYLDSRGTPLDRIAAEFGVPIMVARERIAAARSRPPAFVPGAAEAIDLYVASLGI